MKTLFQLQCAQCTSNFESPKRTRRFCSPQCYADSMKHVRETYLCAHCGARFEALPDHGRPRKLCSAECRESYQVGEKNPAWGGGRRVDRNGYIAVRVGPKQYRGEHRVVVEAALGRRLRSDEFVHHKNGNKHDNRIENLEVLSPHEHAQEHAEEQSLAKTRPPIVCARCGRLRKHGARGYCKPCYSRVNLEERMTRDPEGTRAALAQAQRRSYEAGKRRRSL